MKQVIKVFPWLLLLASIGLGIYGAIKNTEFWTVSAGQILPLLVAIGIAFFASQYKLDQREAKKHVESIIDNIQSIVAVDTFYRIAVVTDPNDRTTYTNSLNTMKRRLANYIDVLEEYGESLDFSEEVTYIKEQYKSYQELVDTFLRDLEYLAKSEVVLKKYADNISNKCDRIILKLYK